MRAAKSRAIGVALALLSVASRPVSADSSAPGLASYYDRHMAIVGGAAFGWTGSARPMRMVGDVKQLGVSRDAYFALKTDGTLLTWKADPAAVSTVMTDVSYFAAGDTGIFAIDTRGDFWHAGKGGAPVRVAEAAAAAAVGDGADYFVTQSGDLFVKGRAHRGQYGDGRLTETDTFVKTAADALDVKAHTGHAILLLRNGDVLGTGGNIYGPLATHGLGDKAIAWGKIFDGAKAVATGASHSAAIRKDGSLWIWGSEFGPRPRKIMERVQAVAAGSTDTIALTEDGRLWQWTGGATPRQLQLSAN